MALLYFLLNGNTRICVERTEKNFKFDANYLPKKKNKKQPNTYIIVQSDIYETADNTHLITGVVK